MKEQLEFIYKGAKTKRFHTTDTLTSQNVGEHSHGVAMLCHLLMPKASSLLIMAALCHDLAEHRVGDVASPVKRRVPELGKLLAELEAKELTTANLNFYDALTDDEKRVLKLADNMDGMMFCVRERLYGNAGIREVFMNFYAYTRDMNLLGREADVFKSIVSLWNEANYKGEVL